MKTSKNWPFENWESHDHFGELLGTEELSGPLKDWIKRRKSNLAKKMSKMPKWKKALLLATGIGLVAPVTATTAMVAATTVGLPTAAAALAMKKSHEKAKQAIKAIKARKAARAAAKLPADPNDDAAIATAQEVLNTPIPQTVNAPAADAAAQSTAAARLAPKTGGVAAAAPWVGAAIGLLSLLKK